MLRIMRLAILALASLPWLGLMAVETQLHVVATDDGLPNGSLTYTWTVKSAPAGVTPPQILATPSTAIPTASSQNPRVVINAAGSYTFHVAVSDGSLTTQGTAAQDVTITVLPQVPTITTTTLPATSVGSAYSQTLAATNTPTTWTISSGTLPAGLSLGSTTGIISGTPTNVVTSTFSVTAANAGGTSIAKSLTLVVNSAAPRISTASLPGGTQTVAYRQTLQASPAATSWQLISGTLPAGLSLNAASGEISGTPTATGTSTFSLTASNAGGTSSAVSLSIAVVSQTNMRPTISTIANQLIAKDTSTAVIAFNIWDNETPTASLTVSATSSLTTLVPNTGIVLGGSGANRTVAVTPATGQVGRATITLTVTDAGGQTGSTIFEIVVNSPPVISSASATQTVLTLP